MSLFSRILQLSSRNFSPSCCVLNRNIRMPPKRKVKDAAENVTEETKETTTKKKNEAAENGEPSTKKTKKEKNTENKLKKQDSRPKIPDVTVMDFSSNAKDTKGNKWNWKFSSWNINGIRAWLEKNGHSYISHENPDVFCVQEMKCDKSKIPKDVEVPGYHVYWLSGDKEGYSGTGMYCKHKPINVTYGIDEEEHDKEGRVITAEFENFYFVTAYVPNAGRGLVRLDYRSKEWDPAFRKYLNNLDAKKPVILCGDLNVAHLDIGIYENRKKLF